ncbi:Rieske (2Fe-2S) protein [Pseudomonas japonica]|uniref:Ferredoxin subunit of nitrite reductase or a ring-hydroxylating dioxygenase n=1 Tax=Pseudomonas japonica TaxID=256466 RepID=A0A239ID99_9PSED|nr:Rieske (2Fe-2S) protein [Pseudomonas japonica]SNS91527.1 Ferredoxin subunit of nitrite reductase or a ring-hydroxylating dioxygenase [Pseudomonas japonica]
MFVALERLINLHDGYRKAFRVNGQALLLLVVDNRPVLIDERCPHQGASLAAATVEGDVLRCPRHGLAFSLSSGRALQPGCAGLSLYKVAYEGDRIGIDV